VPTQFLSRDRLSFSLCGSGQSPQRATVHQIFPSRRISADEGAGRIRGRRRFESPQLPNQPSPPTLTTRPTSSRLLPKANHDCKITPPRSSARHHESPLPLTRPAVKLTRNETSPPCCARTACSHSAWQPPASARLTTRAQAGGDHRDRPVPAATTWNAIAISSAAADSACFSTTALTSLTATTTTPNTRTAPGHDSSDRSLQQRPRQSSATSGGTRKKKPHCDLCPGRCHKARGDQQPRPWFLAAQSAG